jgi:hypothetical protein
LRGSLAASVIFLAASWLEENHPNKNHPLSVESVFGVSFFPPVIAPAPHTDGHLQGTVSRDFLAVSKFFFIKNMTLRYKYVWLLSYNLLRYSTICQPCFGYWYPSVTAYYKRCNWQRWHILSAYDTAETGNLKFRSGLRDQSINQKKNKRIVKLHFIICSKKYLHVHTYSKPIETQFFFSSEVKSILRGKLPKWH